MSVQLDGLYNAKLLQGPLQQAGPPDGGLTIPFTITAWISPAAMPINNLEFGLIAGRPGLTVGADKTLTGVGVPAIYMHRNGTLKAFVVNLSFTTAGAFAYANYRRVEPLDPTVWDFYAGTFALGDGGPRIWSGDLSTSVSEAPAYALRQAEGGNPGKNPPAVVTTADGFVVNGSSQYLGQWCIGGPQEQRIVDPHANFGFPSFNGRIAHVTHWAGPLTKAQLEVIRTAAPSTRASLTSLQGFPQLLGDWWLDDLPANGIYIDRGPLARHLLPYGAGAIPRTGQPAFELNGYIV